MVVAKSLVVSVLAVFAAFPAPQGAFVSTGQVAIPWYARMEWSTAQALVACKPFF